MPSYSPTATNVQTNAQPSSRRTGGPLRGGVLGASASGLSRPGTVIPPVMLGFPPDIFLNFQTNLAQKGAVVSSATSLLTVVRASQGLASDQAGNWFTFGNNVARQTNQGLLVEEARTNLFLNSQAPATQGITVVNASTYAVSVIGVGSLTLSGALSGTVTQGNPVIGAASGTTLTVTTSGITGTFVNAQVELGASVTSPIITAGASATRAADIVTLTSPPVIGSAYSSLASGKPQAPNAYGLPQRILELNDGTASNEVITGRISGTGQNMATFTGGTGGTITATGNWAQNVAGKIAVAAAASDQAVCFNGTLSAPATLAVLPSGLNNIQFGNRPDGTRSWDGYIASAAIWATSRITNAQLQAITR